MSKEDDAMRARVLKAVDLVGPIEVEITLKDVQRLGLVPAEKREAAWWFLTLNKFEAARAETLGLASLHESRFPGVPDGVGVGIGDGEEPVDG